MRSLIFALCLTLLPVTAFADWELYDDFTTAPGDVPLSSLWDTAGNVSVVNGEMKIVFSSTDDPNVWPEATNVDTTNIYGIKFDYRVSGWSESVTDNLNPYFRIVRHFGTYPDASYPRASTLVTAMPDDADPDEYQFRTEYTSLSSDWSQEIDHSAQFHEYYNDTFVGTMRTISLVTSTQGLVASLDGYISRIPFEVPVILNSEPFQLEIRPRNLGDECTVYIDNVYVWRGEPTDVSTICPNNARTVVVPLM